MILDRLREHIVATPLNDDGKPDTHLARYPSPQWNLKSWSYRLVEDLLLERSLHRSRLGEGSGWKLLLAERLIASAHSYHQDAEYKLLLFSALRRHDRARVVMLPEVGPFGFDLLIARAAGFTRFVAYDRDAPTVEACRRFHTGVDVEFLVATSAAFDFSRFTSPEHLIVFPDWPHDDLQRRLAGFSNVLRYSFRDRGLDVARARRQLGLERREWPELLAALERLG